MDNSVQRALDSAKTKLIRTIDNNVKGGFISYNGFISLYDSRSICAVYPCKKGTRINFFQIVKEITIRDMRRCINNQDKLK